MYKKLDPFFTEVELWNSEFITTQIKSLFRVIKEKRKYFSHGCAKGLSNYKSWSSSSKDKGV